MNEISIYLITNLTNNRNYIGYSNKFLSTDDYLKRVRSQNGALEITEDIKSFGVSNFKCMFLETCDKSNLINKKKYYIELNQALYPIGYNSTERLSGPMKKERAPNIAKSKLVVDVVSRTIFSSPLEAGEYFGLKADTIRAHCNGKRGCRSHNFKLVYWDGKDGWYNHIMNIGQTSLGYKTLQQKLLDGDSSLPRV